MEHRIRNEVQKSWAEHVEYSGYTYTLGPDSSYPWEIGMAREESEWGYLQCRSRNRSRTLSFLLWPKGEWRTLIYRVRMKIPPNFLSFLLSAPEVPTHYQ